MKWFQMIVLASCMLVAAPALADTEEPATKTISFEATLTAVSDYRFRGLSLSGEDPALQGGVTTSLANGAYGYVWGSTIEEYGAGADGKGAKVEVDLVLGWAGALAGVDVDVSAQAYRYPGGSDVGYVEFPAQVSKAAGDWRWTLGGAYAPSQKALGHKDNSYGWGAIAWGGQASPFEVEVRTGYERGAYAPGGKWDWSAGVTRSFGPVAASIAYVDSDDPSGSAGVVASLGATF